jgi:chromosome segregation ATPase
MSKKNISATVDEDVERFLSQEHINTSGLINDLVSQYMQGGTEQAAMLRLREEQLRSELEALKQQRESKRKELERLTQSREEIESGPDIGDELNKILDDLEQRGTHVWPEAQPIQDLAGEHSLQPGDVLERLKHRAAEQGRDITTHQFHRADLPPDAPDMPVTEVYDGD